MYSSCSLCRRRKIRCNRETPCSNCLRSKHNTCVYEKQSFRPPRQHVGQGPPSEHSQLQRSGEPVPIHRTSSTSRGSPVLRNSSTSLMNSSTSASNLVDHPSPQDVESMKLKIRQLEEELAKLSPSSIQSSDPKSSPKTQMTTSQVGMTLYVHCEQPQAIIRSITHKTRVFGQSHWISGVAQVSSC